MVPFLRLFLPAALLLLHIGHAIADYTLYKSGSGLLIVSSSPGAYFSFEVPGKSITPADMETSPHPRLFVDDYYLEIIPLPVEGKLPTEPKEELELLNSHFESAKTARKGPPSKIKSEAIKLSGGTVGLTWSFIPFGDTERFYCLVFRSNKTVFLLKSGLEEKGSKDDPSAFLRDVAKSFVRSETPISAPK